MLLHPQKLKHKYDSQVCRDVIINIRNLMSHLNLSSLSPPSTTTTMTNVFKSLIIVTNAQPDC